MNVNSRTWRECKEARILQIGKICEVCGRKRKRKELIGHHLLGESFMEEHGLIIPDLCEIRDRGCEERCHRKFRDGNPPKSKARIAEWRRNNPLF